VTGRGEAVAAHPVVVRQGIQQGRLVVIHTRDTYPPTAMDSLKSQIGRSPPMTTLTSTNAPVTAALMVWPGADWAPLPRQVEPRRRAYR
jgi:hypothetical protein